MYQLLEGLKVLDFTRHFPGGFATQLLGDMGAKILKVEDPWVGDLTRWLEPYFEGLEESPLSWGVNRNKRSIKLNLKENRGREIVHELVKEYDIVIEGFRPGVMDDLGIGYEDLKEKNPGVIMCSISSYGQDGPYRKRSGHDVNYISLSGLLNITGRDETPPIIPSVQIGDVGGGSLMAIAGIFGAVYQREKDGKGQHIDVSMTDGAISFATMLIMQLAAKESPKRGELTLGGGIPCYNVYQTKDGKYMSLGALGQKFWENFCKTVGKDELIPKGFSKDPKVIEEVKEVFLERTRDEWEEFFAGSDVCCEPVLSPEELLDHPQLKHRGILKNLPHPKAGDVNVVDIPIKFKNEEKNAHKLPPEHGEHTTKVLSELGYGEKELQKLKQDKIIE